MHQLLSCICLSWSGSWSVLTSSGHRKQEDHREGSQMKWRRTWLQKSYVAREMFPLFAWWFFAFLHKTFWEGFQTQGRSLISDHFFNLGILDGPKSGWMVQQEGRSWELELHDKQGFQSLSSGDRSQQQTFETAGLRHALRVNLLRAVYSARLCLYSETKCDELVPKKPRCKCSQRQRNQCNHNSVRNVFNWMEKCIHYWCDRRWMQQKVFGRTLSKLSEESMFCFCRTFAEPHGNLISMNSTAFRINSV